MRTWEASLLTISHQFSDRATILNVTEEINRAQAPIAKEASCRQIVSA
jgi:hypothetical protein